jgi:large repetitive protein
MRFTRILLLASLIALIVTPVALALRFTDGSYTPPTGETGKNYFFKFDGAGGCGPALPYQFTAINGAPPPGLTLHRDGTVDGKPTQTGSFSFWVELSDENPPSQSWCRPSTAQREFTIKIVQGLLINETASVLGEAPINQAYNKQLTTTGAGGATLIWSIPSGALPPGVTINSGSGLISGTPTQVGDYTFKVKVTDGTRTDVQTYTLGVAEPLKITSPASATGLPNTPITLQLTASGGRGAYKWTAEGVPAGFAFDPNTAAITGTSATPGSFTVKVTVTDAYGAQQTMNVTIQVGAKLAVVHSGPLPTAKVGKKYTARLTATGGIAPRTWSIIGGRPGTLPPGIKLNTRTGVFSGKPTKAGTWRLRMQVTDATGAHAALGILIKVLKGSSTTHR